MSNKKEIIKRLQKIARELGKSPTRREIPGTPNIKCIQNFGSFNNAKLKAGLTIQERNKTIPKNIKLDKRLVRIVSHLTFDGHLGKELRMFHFSSNDKRELERLRKDTYQKFTVDVSKIERGMGYGSKVWKYWYFHANLSRFLYSVGTPKGDKMITQFDIPDWIKENKAFAREYLRVAFFCEGSKFKKSKNKEEIQINLNKSTELLPDGLNFMDSLKNLLSIFGIESTKIWIQKGNLRKDGRVTKLMRFKLKANSVNTFIKEIGWCK